MSRCTERDLEGILQNFKLHATTITIIYFGDEITPMVTDFTRKYHETFTQIKELTYKYFEKVTFITDISQMNSIFNKNEYLNLYLDRKQLTYNFIKKIFDNK